MSQRCYTKHRHVMVEHWAGGRGALRLEFQSTADTRSQLRAIKHLSLSMFLGGL